MNFEKSCLCCLKDNAVKHEDYKEDGITLFEKFLIVAGRINERKISSFNRRPKKFCMACFIKVSRAYQLYNLINASVREIEKYQEDKTVEQTGDQGRSSELITKIEIENEEITSFERVDVSISRRISLSGNVGMSEQTTVKKTVQKIKRRRSTSVLEICEAKRIRREFDSTNEEKIDTNSTRKTNSRRARSLSPEPVVVQEESSRNETEAVPKQTPKPPKQKQPRKKSSKIPNDKNLSGPEQGSKNSEPTPTKPIKQPKSKEMPPRRFSTRLSEKIQPKYCESPRQKGRKSKLPPSTEKPLKAKENLTKKLQETKKDWAPKKDQIGKVEVVLRTLRNRKISAYVEA